MTKAMTQTRIKAKMTMRAICQPFKPSSSSSSEVTGGATGARVGTTDEAVMPYNCNPFKLFVALAAIIALVTKRNNKIICRWYWLVDAKN